MLSFSRNMSRAGRETKELERTVAAGARSLWGRWLWWGEEALGPGRGEEDVGLVSVGQLLGLPGGQRTDLHFVL